MLANRMSNPRKLKLELDGGASQKLVAATQGQTHFSLQWIMVE